MVKNKLFFPVNCFGVPVLIHLSCASSAPELHVTSPRCRRAELSDHSFSRQVTFTPSLPFAPCLRAGAIFEVLLLPPRPWHSADSHMTTFIPSYRLPFPNNMDGIGQPLNMERRAEARQIKAHYFDISHMSLLLSPPQCSSQAMPFPPCSAWAWLNWFYLKK